MTLATDLVFAHRFVPAGVQGRPPVLLLHGTGGDEDDLLPLGAAIAPGAALLSPRGRVLENGMPRFFRRLAEGVFDPVEVRQRAHELADFIVAARQVYDLPAPIAVGFSNGANVAGAVLALRPGVLAGAVLLRPMTVFEDRAIAGASTPVLILSGATDPIVPLDSARGLAARLREGGAEVVHQVLEAGHGLTRTDAAIAKAWMEERPAARGATRDIGE